MGQIVAGGNDNRHHLAAVHAHASHHMAHHALARFFVIGTDIIMLHPLAYRGQNRIISLLGNKAAIGVDNIMRGGGIAAYL